jgi:predicted DCC family thiol-disulfide oxidoreductase YuxK
MEALAHKWIIYDGNCGLCLNSKKMLTRLGIIPEEKCLNYHLLEDKITAKIDAEHFRYEMALVDDRTDQTLYGLEGILHIFAARLGMKNGIRPGSTIFGVLNFLYHTISYNRYFLFPRKSRFACDCDPPFVQKYFMRWVVLGSIIATLISGLFGAAVAPLFDRPVLQMAGEMLLIVGTGWGLQILLSSLIMTKAQRQDYYRHLVLIMVVGVLILIPTLILFWLPLPGLAGVAIANVLASSVVMSLLHYRRVRHMNLSQGWTLSWFLFLQIAAICFTLYFNLFEL